MRQTIRRVVIDSLRTWDLSFHLPFVSWLHVQNLPQISRQTQRPNAHHDAHPRTRNPPPHPHRPPAPPRTPYPRSADCQVCRRDTVAPIQNPKSKIENRAALAALDPARVTPDGALLYDAFGGDYGDWPNDGNFLCNGIMAADLTPKPHAAEVFHQYRNILVTPLDLAAAQPRLRVLNENFFRTLDAQPCRWTLLEDGLPLATGAAALPPLAPQKTAGIAIPLDATLRARAAAHPQSEYHLTIEFPQGAPRPWAAADFIIAREQFAIWSGTGCQPVGAASSPAPIRTTRAHGLTTITGQNFSATIDDRTAQLTSYKIAGQQLLSAPLRLNFWRAPTVTDIGSKIAATCAIWRAAGENAKVTYRTQTGAGSAGNAEIPLGGRREAPPEQPSENSALPDGKSAAIVLTYDLAIPAGKTTARIEYTIHPDATITVTLRLRPAAAPPQPRPIENRKSKIENSLPPSPASA